MSSYAPAPTLPPILRLPAEIRLHVYEYLDLVQSCPISIHDASDRPPPVGRTCRLLREESMDCFFGRNRFMTSNFFGLSATLERITAENVSRIARLRLNHLGNDSTRLQFSSPERVTTGFFYVDIDILQKHPWLRVECKPIDATKVAPLAMPNILTYMRKRTLPIDRHRLERFEGLLDNNIRLLLVPELMTRILQSIVEGTGGSALKLDAKMPESIVRNWLWVSHILTCNKRDPADCEKCVRVLTWLLD